MSRRDSLGTRTTRICGTIYFPSDFTQTDMISICDKLMHSLDFVIDYYFILHDDAEFLHVHYIILSSQVKRLQTYLNNINCILNFDEKLISVETLKNLNMYLRYFMHLDESDNVKRYLVTEIHSNKSVDEINYLLDNDTEELTAIQLIISVIKYPRSHDLMVHLGLHRFHKYRYEIRELQDNYMTISNQYKHLIDNTNDLPF